MRSPPARRPEPAAEAQVNNKEHSSGAQQPDAAGTQQRFVSPGRLKLAAIIAAVIAALVVIGGIISRRSDETAVADWTRAQTIPSVTIIKPSTEGVGGTIVLPGSRRGFLARPRSMRASAAISPKPGIRTLALR